MSERDLKRIEVLTEILAGRRTVESGAAVMGLAWRQTFRLLARYKELGVASVMHQARGRASNRQMNPDVREYAVELVRTRYADFGPTLAAEVLLEKHGIKVGRETLQRWMVEDGLWLSRKQRRTFHQPRLRRESYGELVQIGGSEHRWFEQRGEPCTLLVFIDDATSRLMQLRFVPSESTSSYFEALRGYLETHGCPVAFYSDKHSVFRVNRSEAKGGTGMTQFGRALTELNIEIICANSSQAKGRVERANRTLQDRLVKELRIENVSSIEAGNAFLPDFVGRFNERFAIRPAKTNDLHQQLRLKPDRLDDVLCHREQRHVGEQLTLACDRKQLILDRSTVSDELSGQYVHPYDFPDGRLEVRWKGRVLPYRTFHKDQRVNAAAIIENKRLGHALSPIKAQ
ncbi:Integrase catalytic region (plasmid) [Granulicella tundricola MP5ACTX9]|uniref:Integrase catalytic region n=1 Tax=Granulicella tundricola (strain ATCC BAA-1859 / DSM 23138 / MP5ACTX9) TaxID=1198114 RepID=E8X728_GRATM|nr:Integrase catalytic region [Granulicella tundricola MP5ACTX9]